MKSTNMKTENLRVLRDVCLVLGIFGVIAIFLQYFMKQAEN